MLGGISFVAGDWIMDYTALLFSGCNWDPELFRLRFHLTDDGGAIVEGRCPGDDDAGVSLCEHYTEVFSLARYRSIKSPDLVIIMMGQ